MTKYTAFRCPEDLLAKAKIKAESDRRSLSKYIVLLIEKNTADVILPAKASSKGKPAKTAPAAKPTKAAPAAKPGRKKKA